MSDDFLDEDDQSYNPPCPVCGRLSFDGPCPHLVSSWSYAEDTGEWAAEPHPEELRAAVQGLLDALHRGFTERLLRGLAEFLALTAGLTCPQRGVLTALLALPQEVLTEVARSVREGYFSGFGWDAYLGQVAAAGHTFAGSGECETDTPGCCSVWTNHWASDPRAWAASVGPRVRRAVRGVERARAAADRLPCVG